MSTPARAIRVVAAALAVIAIGLVSWWFVEGRDVPSASADRAAGEPTQAPVASPTIVSPTATPEPTATPIPTPTPVPTPLPFDQAVPLGQARDLLSTPLPDCGLLRDDEIVAGTVTLRCLEDWASAPVAAAAPGRVVHVSSAVADETTGVGALATDVAPGEWSWAEQAQLGRHIVIDHGPLGESSSVQTVYAGLASIESDIAVGAEVAVGQQVGTVEGPSAALRFSIWTNDQRQDGARVLADGPPVDQQRQVAAALAPLLASPTDPACPLVRSSSQLPGAPREYRNGTHRGIDFGCGAADRSAFAIADGTVVYLVNDYEDPTVAEREALLRQAGLAGFTPHWTLVMLYGNVVVIDHGDIPGAGRLVTIAAHLEEVDPAVELGVSVIQGQRLGELGNRGTNASAQGIRGAADPSLHLHWELFVDNWYLGSGLDAFAISELVTTTLCGAAQTPGCPA